MAYGTDAGFQAWLDANGYVLPEGSPSLAVLRARGSMYVDATYEGLWTGERFDGVLQEDGWPRVNARLNCIKPIASDAIPVSVVNAAYRAGWLEANTPGTLNASTTSGQRVAREKVDVIEVAYHNDGAASVGSGAVAFIDSVIDGAMRAFICDKTGGFFLRAVGPYSG